MSRRIFPPLLLLASAACSGDQARPASPSVVRGSDSVMAVVDSLGVAADSAARPATAYLVWSADSAGAVTVWLDGDGHVAARHRGVAIASGARLWRWVDRETAVTGVDCECMRENPDATCPVTRPVRVSELVDGTGGHRLAILEADTGEVAREQTPPVLAARPVAGAGPYLFTESHAETDGCGAHGFSGTWREVYHLPTEARIETDTLRVSPEDSAAGLNALVETNPLDDPVTGWTLDGVEAWWTPAGTLQVGLRFHTPVPYAFSDEGGYTRSQRIATRNPPRWLAPWLRAPDAVRRYWQSHPPGERAGWSAVDAAHATALFQRFQG